MDALARLAKSFDESKGRAPQPWDDSDWWPGNLGIDPEACPVVTGTVVEVGHGTGPHGTYAVVVVRLEDGTYTKVTGQRKAMGAKLEEAGVAVGDLVKVEYTGFRDSVRGGNGYHGYAFGHVRNETLAQESEIYGG